MEVSHQTETLESQKWDFVNVYSSPNQRNRLMEWYRQYGPIYSLKLGRDTVIVLNKREAIRDLWEKKSQNYSDRPDGYVFKLLTKNHHAAFQSVGDSWRDRRRLISHHFSPHQCDTVHASIQNAE